MSQQAPILENNGTFNLAGTIFALTLLSSTGGVAEGASITMGGQHRGKAAVGGAQAFGVSPRRGALTEEAPAVEEEWLAGDYGTDAISVFRWVRDEIDSLDVELDAFTPLPDAPVVRTVKAKIRKVYNAPLDIVVDDADTYAE